MSVADELRRMAPEGSHWGWIGDTTATGGSAAPLPPQMTPVQDACSLRTLGMVPCRHVLIGPASSAVVRHCRHMVMPRACCIVACPPLGSSGLCLGSCHAGSESQPGLTTTPVGSMQQQFMPDLAMLVEHLRHLHPVIHLAVCQKPGNAWGRSGHLRYRGCGCSA